MAGNAIIEILDQVGELRKEVQKLQIQVAKAPAASAIDTNKLATELGSKMNDRTAANEEIARRIEIAVSKIPASVSMIEQEVFVIEWRTAYWIAFVAAMVAATAVYLVMVANPAVARYLDDKSVETREHLQYHIERNPKTELGYYNRK